MTPINLVKLKCNFAQLRIATRVESGNQAMPAVALPFSYAILILKSDVYNDTQILRIYFVKNKNFPFSVIGTGLRKLTYLNRDTIGNTLTSLCVTDCQVLSCLCPLYVFCAHESCVITYRVFCLHM